VASLERMEYSMILKERVRLWVSRSAQVLATTTFAQSDLDEFMEDGKTPEYAARVGVDLFLSIIDEVASSGLDVDVLLTIPLPWANAVTMECPVLDDVLGEQWTSLEVPGFYLLRPDHWRLYDEVEEYRAPIPSSYRAKRPIAAYYRTFLNGGKRDGGAEYPRVIYLRTI
jgi:hypothetical protein